MSGSTIPSEGCTINTYVFLDLETTGLPDTKPRITEISLIAVHRHNLLASAINNEPRIIDKLTVCIYPMKTINIYAAEITGLYSDTLLYQKDLDDNLADMLHLFLRRHEEPLCLVAHNGNKFDFTLLRCELARIGRSLPDGILCVDSLLLYRELDSLSPLQTFISDEGSTHSRSDLGEIDTQCHQETPIKCTSNVRPELGKSAVSSVQRKLTFPVDQEEMSHLETSENAGCAWNAGLHVRMDDSVSNTQLLCEANDKHSDTQQTARLSSKKSSNSYSLKNLHRRIFGSDPPVSHRAEDDCMTLLRMFHKTSVRALPWVDTHAVRFDSIDYMYSPQKREPLPPGVFPSH